MDTTACGRAASAGAARGREGPTRVSLGDRREGDRTDRASRSWWSGLHGR
jgi:hypothetical protein